MIKFNQNSWVEPYIYINTDLRIKRKKKQDLQKYVFKLMNKTFFGKKY